MDDWQQEWARTLETVAEGVGQFFEEVGKEVDRALDALIDFTDDLAEGWEQTLEQVIPPEVDQIDDRLMEWLDPILQTFTGLESTLDRTVEPITHTVEPLLNQHPVCIGCRHYHGQSYNGVMLVCGMHPFGMEEGIDSCPDKEPVDWSFPPSWRSSDEDNSDRW